MWLIDIKKSQGAPQPAHHAMTEIRLQKLVRARTWDDRDPVFAAQAHRLRGNAGYARYQARLGTHHAVHPYVLDSQFYTLPDDLLGHTRAGQDEDGVGLLRKRLQIRIARIVLKSVDAGVDRIDHVA